MGFVKCFIKDQPDAIVSFLPYSLPSIGEKIRYAGKKYIVKDVIHVLDGGQNAQIILEELSVD